MSILWIIATSVGAVMNVAASVTISQSPSDAANNVIGTHEP